MAEQRAAKKKWFRIVAPAFLGEETVGETLAEEPRTLVGKFVTISLATLTGDMKQQSIHVKLKVVSVEDGTARTELYGFGMAPSSLKRLVRRNSDRIDDSFVCTTADGKRVRIKPVMLTSSKAKGAVQRVLRRLITSAIVREIQSLPYEEAVKSVLSYRLQTAVRNHLRKTYPVKYFEIKKFEQARRGKPVSVPQAPQALETPEEEQAGEAEA